MADCVGCAECGWRGKRKYRHCECCDRCNCPSHGHCPKCGDKLLATKLIAVYRQANKDLAKSRKAMNIV